MSNAETIDRHRIFRIRLSLNMNVNQFADYCGITRQTVTNWEVGRTEPTGPAVRMLLLLGERQGV